MMETSHPRIVEYKLITLILYLIESSMASYDQMSPRDNILAEVEVIKEWINTPCRLIDIKISS